MQETVVADPRPALSASPELRIEADFRTRLVEKHGSAIKRLDFGAEGLLRENVVNRYQREPAANKPTHQSVGEKRIAPLTIRRRIGWSILSATYNEASSGPQTDAPRNHLRAGGKNRHPIRTASRKFAQRIK